MPTAHERHLIAFYLANAAERFHHRDREASDLAEWIAGRNRRHAFDGRKGPISRLTRTLPAPYLRRT